MKLFDVSHMTDDVLCLCTEFSMMLLFWLRWKANAPTVLFSAAIYLVSELQLFFRCSRLEDEYTSGGFGGWLGALPLNENPFLEISIIYCIIFPTFNGCSEVNMLSLLVSCL
jgi:hypothetical protein